MSAIAFHRCVSLIGLLIDCSIHLADPSTIAVVIN